MSFRPARRAPSSTAFRPRRVFSAAAAAARFRPTVLRSRALATSATTVSEPRTTAAPTKNSQCSTTKE
ncbi:hypothetical protein GMA12_09490 [Kocuria sediminis]|uniref:Uncharacterized protein n=1 Tax=Kocuria sediminis TaxID=1038857 RepID=A0A6N8GKD3_9MICC|nr:hypothetical protein [Kocuria sediminis]MUN63368.1 hypothetical protein [Kocuria sediminis]